jgi:hypothetical protein
MAGREQSRRRELLVGLVEGVEEGERTGLGRMGLQRGFGGEYCVGALSIVVGTGRGAIGVNEFAGRTLGVVGLWWESDSGLARRWAVVGELPDDPEEYDSLRLRLLFPWDNWW